MLAFAEHEIDEKVAARNLIALRSILTDLTDKLSSFENVEDDLRNQSEKYADLLLIYEEKERHSEEVDALYDSLLKENELLCERKQHLETLQDGQKRKLNLLARQLSEGKVSMLKVQSEREAAQAELRDLKEEAKLLTCKNQGLREHLKLKTRDYETLMKLKIESEDLSSEKEIELIKKENCITRLKVELQQKSSFLKAEKATSCQLKADKDSLQTLNESLAIANGSYALEVQALKSDLKLFQESNGNVNEINQNLILERAKTTELKKEFQRLRDEVKEKLLTASRENQTLKQNLRSIEIEKCSVEEELDSKKRNILELKADLRIALERLSEAMQGHENDRGSAKGEISSLKEKIAESEIELSKSQHLVEEQKKVIVDLNARIDAYRVAGDDRSEILLLEGKIAKWHSDHEELLAKYGSLEKDFEAISAKSVQTEKILRETDKSKKHQISELNHKLLEMQKANDASLDSIQQKLDNEKSEYENCVMKMNLDKEDKDRKITETVSRLNLIREAVQNYDVSLKAARPAFECVKCHNLYVDPVTCQPCGHSYCKGCISALKNKCIQCGNTKRKSYPNEILSSLTKDHINTNHFLEVIKKSLISGKV